MISIATTKSIRVTGIVQVLLSGVAFGFLGLLGKSAYAAGVTPGELLSFRFLIGGSMLGVYVATTSHARLAIGRDAVLACALLGTLGYAVFSSCFFYALNGLSASLTVLLLYTYPVMVAVGAWIFFRERIPKERWFVLPASMAGLLLLVWGEFFVRDSSALAFGLAAAFFYSVYILYSSRALKNVDALASVVYIQLFAGLALSLVHWRDAGRLLHVVHEAWPTLIAVALLCSVVAMSLFMAGLQKLRSWEVSVLSTAEPITGVALAFAFLGERLTEMQVFGAILVLAAFVFVSLPAKSEG